MALFDTLTTVWDGMNTARDLSTADPATLSPVEQVARSGVRAYCRVADWTNDQVWTLGAGVGANYICGPVWDEPGNAPPDGSCVTYIDLVGDAFGGGSDCSNRVDWSRTVTWDGSHTGVTISRGCGGPGGACGDEFGYQFTDDAGNVSDCRTSSIGFFSNLAIADARVSCSGPTIADPYTPGNPINTPYGPITVEPKPWGPRINLPDGPPIDIPVDPVVPPPTGGPDNGPIIPHPDGPVTPGPDGDTDFPPAPEGFEYIGAAWVITSGTDIPGVIPGTQANPVFPKVSGNMRLKVEQNDLTVASTDATIRAVSGFVVRNNPGLLVKGVFVNTLPLITIEIYPLLGEIA